MDNVYINGKRSVLMALVNDSTSLTENVLDILELETVFRSETKVREFIYRLIPWIAK